MAQPASSSPPVPPEGPSLALLAEIFDAGSLTAAARLMGTTQPALSKRLQRLEQTLGVTVFERGTRGVVPTAYGAALLPRARAIRAQARQAMEEVAQMRGSREGHVTVALSHLAAIALLPRVINEFRHAWPQVTVAITPPNFQFAGLREGAPDFAVISLPQGNPGPEFATRALYTTRVVAVTRAGHALARARQLADLREAEWVLPSADSSTALALKRAFGRARLGAPRCPITCETLTGLEALLQSTDLVGAMPLEVHEQRKGASGLIRLPLEQSIEGPRVAIVRWADAKPTPAAAALADLFVSAGHQLARRKRA
jgi:DNA-binding transcriptional LysR family regulator